MRRQWRLVAACVLLAIAATFLPSLRAAPQYVSTAQLFVSEPQRDRAGPYTGSQVARQRATTYADLVDGEEVARRVIDGLGLDDSPRAIAEQVSASVVPETVMLNVAVSDADPERARLLAETVSEEFAAFVKELETPVGRSTAPVRVMVVDAPSAPEPWSTSPSVQNIGMAIVLGLLLGVGLAALRTTRTAVRPT